MSAQGVRASAIRQSIIAGAALALLALLGGMAVAVTQQRVWTAEAVAVVLPARALDDATSAAYYETLSRGQIVATFAEVASNLRFEQQAEDRLQLNSSVRTSLTTRVTVVPDTSVILVRVTSPNAVLAEQVADTTTAIVAEYLGKLAQPYRIDSVNSARGTAYSSSTSPVLLVIATIVVALVAGLAFQQAVYHLLVALRGPSARWSRSRGARSKDATGGQVQGWGWW
jgi:capsular polysaccharide biosynthesis protein